jgi:hypothetical protein
MVLVSVTKKKLALKIDFSLIGNVFAVDSSLLMGDPSGSFRILFVDEITPV